jgi:hypothetical protein
VTDDDSLIDQRAHREALTPAQDRCLQTGHDKYKSPIVEVEVPCSTALFACLSATNE